MVAVRTPTVPHSSMPRGGVSPGWGQEEKLGCNPQTQGGQELDRCRASCAPPLLALGRWLQVQEGLLPRGVREAAVPRAQWWTPSLLHELLRVLPLRTRTLRQVLVLPLAHAYSQVRVLPLRTCTLRQVRFAAVPCPSQECGAARRALQRPWGVTSRRV